MQFRQRDSSELAKFGTPVSTFRHNHFPLEDNGTRAETVRLPSCGCHHFQTNPASTSGKWTAGWCMWGRREHH